MASCGKKEEIVNVRQLDVKKDARAIEAITQSSEMPVPFPEGAYATKVSENCVYIHLPEGYEYVFTSLEKPMKAVPPEEGAGIICTCTGGSKENCSPATFNGQYACVMAGSCTNCSKNITDKAGNAVIIAGMINRERGINFITDKKMDGLYRAFTTSKGEVFGNAFAALFRVPGAKEDLMKLHTLIYGKEIPAFILNNEQVLPKGYKYVQISIYGNAAAIPLPVNKIDPYMMTVPGDGGDDPGDDGGGEAGSTMCKCLTGNAGCKKGSSIIGAVWCDARGCSKCELRD